ncbi:AP2-like ethylene-responsive transcription factor PLT1 [Malania oleifera]|uniref:AP2-like ethylene-responsive transcription factor PLT1 n=1 Tax=Malania oleifera TaxID=397392 RepID=UPI0025AE6612|nr:AP2-like ethylene-responsive transcription factor PLT1 [Malania oleifera]XP_057982442.1 AP2-like ethylene-responsive transcription factor PLT1 [Malania oleifera]XP_057982443.1 AP2-like ethylene-responsive transcription factor PLT1 [Malania oleifera]XP_057982444.1 AP2-like ethylene-responsive transcription factor PLT1 [Malania oleifera]XP_057982445.1 AP2-like ethylene-responsive transcription factor PLT1 [Malania oleifera]XP_057982446.1 AP2-like ethylene-responsive transcription factor PLT1 
MCISCSHSWHLAVYVGVFDEEEEAARAYDLAALKFWGKSTPTNFPISDYENDLEEMQNMTKKEYLLSIRRKSKCFSKGASIYRGVSRNTDYTKWQARVGRGHGLRGIYLGTFDTEEEAARAYDIALIRFKGMKAVTNFDLSHYDVKSILGSNTLPIGKGASRLLKKTSVNDVISRRRKGSNDPMFGLQKDSSSSFQPHTQIQSFNQPETTKMMPSAQNQEVAFHQEDSKYANDHLAMTQAGIESPYWKGFKEMQQFERLQTLPTNPQAQNFKFHPQGCNDINQVLHQNPSSSLLSHGYQNPKFQVNPTIFLHQFMPSIGSGVENDENFSEKKLKGVGPIEPFEHFQGTLSNPQDQTFDHFHEKCNETSSQVQHQNPTFSICHGYQNPLFQINPNLFLGLTDIGSATGTHATLDGQLTDKGNISEKNLITIMDTIHGSSSGAGAWSEIQQVQPFDQHFQTQHPQNLHFHHIPKDTNPLMHQNPKPHANPPFLNGLVNGISGAGVSDSTRCTLFGGNPSSGFSISDGNSTIIMGKEGRMFSTSGRNGFPMIGASVGENSRREMNGEGGNGGWTENFGSDEPNINSPSSWLENFFKDADPPSFIL